MIRWAIRELRAPPSDVALKSWASLVFGIWRREIKSTWARSLADFSLGIVRRWLWLVPGLFLGLISLYGAASGNPTPRIAPSITWAAILGGLLIAALGEYQAVRIERDELAEKAKIALNKHLSKGHALRRDLLDKSHEVENPLIRTISWVLTAEVLIRDHAPGYYRRWELSIPTDKGMGEQFIKGIATLDGICREIGVD